MLQKSNQQGQPPPTTTFNDDSLLDADDSQDFQLRNQNYNLKIKINNLEYENNKLSLDYENKIKELKQKNMNLEMRVQQLMSGSGGVNSKQKEMKNQIAYLIDENEQLKRELLAISEKNRVTPNFNAPEFAQDVAALNAFLNKQQNSDQLESGPERTSLEEVSELRQKIVQLQKENGKLNEESGRLKQQLAKTEQERKEIVTRMKEENGKLRDQLDKVQLEKKQSGKNHSQDLEQKYTTMLKEKEKANDQLKKTVDDLKKTVEEMSKQQRNLNVQLNESKKTLSQMSATHNDIANQQKKMKLMSSQYRQKQTRIVELQQTINRLEVQLNRTKSQKSKLQQQYKFYEQDRKQSESKRKTMQEQLYKIQNEYTQAKAIWMNQKMELKKQYNSLRFDSSDELGQLKQRVEEMGQENKKLRDSFMKISEQNDELTQKQINYTSNLDKANKEIKFLNSNIDNLNSQIETLRSQLNTHNNAKNYESEVQALQEEVFKQKSEIRKSTATLQHSHQEVLRLEEEIKHKEELIQILKIDKEESSSRVKELESKIKQGDIKVEEKQNVIKKLEEDIKIYKFDNKQLEIANDELRQRYETLTKIKAQIEAMNIQLKTQKISLDKRKQEERLKQDNPSPKVITNSSKTAPKAEPLNKRGSLFSLVSSIKKSEPLEMMQIPQNFGRLHSKESEEGAEVLMDIVKQLKAQNYELQAKIGQIENERDRKAVDLSIKQEQIKNLKKGKQLQPDQERYQPRQVNFEPIIHSTKRTQFNVIFFENQIASLQKEVREVRQMRRKELEQQKKELKKQFEDKYHFEMKRQQSYIHELEKNINHTKHKYEGAKQQIQQLSTKLQLLEAENYNTKLQLSTNLEEQNLILQQCKQFEMKYNQINNSHKLAQVQHLRRQKQEQKVMLENANKQIVRLNEVLMIKENQLRSVSQRGQHLSPNSSFASRYRPNNYNQTGSYHIQQIYQNDRVSQSNSVHGSRTQHRNPATFSRI